MGRRVIAAVVASLGMAVAACGSGGTSSAASAPTHTPTSGPPVAVGRTIGAGCARIRATGLPSFSSVAAVPVATVAARSAVLSDLVRAIRAAGLTHRLNSARAITVFAPDNAAFVALGSGNLTALLDTKSDLTKVLEYHIVSGRQTPADLASGKHLSTLAGTVIAPAKSSHGYVVNDARIVCGNIQTANATLYIVSQVLVPIP